MTQTETVQSAPNYREAMTGAASVVVHEGKLYVQASEVRSYRVELEPKPVNKLEFERALALGYWVGYQLGRKIIHWVDQSVETRAAYEYLRQGPSTEAIRRARDGVEKELSAANLRIDELKSIAIDLAMMAEV